MTDNNSAKLADSIPSLNPNAATFVPTFIKQKQPQTPAEDLNDSKNASQQQFNINAPVFKPPKKTTAG